MAAYVYCMLRLIIIHALALQKIAELETAMTNAFYM